MSSLFGKWSNALVQGVNENNLSLANINLDFSLIKVTAPEEYLPLGQAMSLQRRNAAEEGPVHQTARRLGALFSQIVPTTPKLVKAFGQRVSEIMKTPGANPKGTSLDGPFRNYVGIDATSIWASATSGPASISVLLLACMLARKIDDAKISVALWVQLINLRQAEIKHAAEVNGHYLDASVLAAQQRILRDDVAAFDSSVRSWLSIADQVMDKSRKQLDLILNNLNMPYVVSPGEDSYEKVLSAWTSALNGFEAILDGKPQTISESSLLLALSSWHLYPCLLVLSSEPKKVDFADKLMPKHAVITVGLQFTSTDEVFSGFRWSLALSHLKYYGDPMRPEINDNNRLTMEELEMLTLGAIFAHWNIPMSSTLDAARWISALEKRLRSANTDILAKSEQRLKVAEEDYLEGQKPAMHRQEQPLSSFYDIPAWLKPLARAAAMYTSSEGVDRDVHDNLVKCGRRRSGRLLPPAAAVTESPYFGLGNPHILRAMANSPGREATIRYLRSIGGDINIGASKAVLAYIHKFGRHSVRVIATVIPHHRISSKRGKSGIQKQVEVHARWISPYQFGENHWDWEGDVKRLGMPADEEVYFLTDQNSQFNFDEAYQYQNTEYTWHNPPPLYLHSGNTAKCHISRVPDKAVTCGCFGKKDISAHSQKKHTPTDNSDQPCIQFIPIFGSTEEVCFCITREDDEIMTLASNISDETLIIHKISEESQRCLDSSTALASLCMHSLDAVALVDHFQRITENSFGSSISAPLRLGRSALSQSVKDSLEALSLSTEVLGQCPSSTIPMKISNQPFLKGRWFPDSSEHQNLDSDSLYPASKESSSLRTVDELLQRMTRARTFACICMLESGGTDVAPSYFERSFALSSSNSIYVAGALLTDPSISVPQFAVKRIVGNIGVPGISVILSPEVLRVACATDSIRTIQHQPYDYRRDDSFAGVTLHLSITDWRVPIPTGTVGLIDQDIFLTEAIVSVHDSGKWYADIDVLAASSSSAAILSGDCRCGQPKDRFAESHVSIDTFDELLEPPEEPGIVRAHGNWAARLAAVCIYKQLALPGRPVIFDNEIKCWQCLEEVSAERRRAGMEKRVTIFVD